MKAAGTEIFDRNSDSERMIIASRSENKILFSERPTVWPHPTAYATKLFFEPDGLEIRPGLVSALEHSWQVVFRLPT